MSKKNATCNQNDAVENGELGSDASNLMAMQGFIGAAGGMATQSGTAQNYAVYTTVDDVDILTFYYGTPTGTASVDYYEGYDTQLISVTCSMAVRIWSPLHLAKASKRKKLSP